MKMLKEKVNEKQLDVSWAGEGMIKRKRSESERTCSLLVGVRALDPTLSLDLVPLRKTKKTKQKKQEDLGR